MLKRFVCVLAAIGSMAALPLPSGAQYPVKPIRVVMPFPAGTPLDIATRVIAQPLAQSLGQPVLVENKPGAEGAIAADAVAKSSPDGYTLFLATNGAMAAVPAMRTNPPYDPLADFTPITLVGNYAFFLFVHAGVPATSVRELIEFARAHPGKISYGASSATAIFASARLASLGQISMVRVPYKGDTQAFSDFVNGRIQMLIGPPMTWLPPIREGKLRALATLLSRRSPLLPEVPTMAEAGLTNISFVPWAAFFGPRGMRRETVELLNREMRAALQRPEVREQLDRQAFEATGSTPEELAAYLKEQLDLWRKMSAELGMKTE